MATKRQIEEAIIAMNHNTTQIVKGLAYGKAERADIINELKRMNTNNFRINFALIIILGALVGIKLVMP